MNALLKNIPLILLVAFGTASCSYYVAPGGLPVPTTPADKPFPKDASRDSFTSVYVWRCLEGKYTGEKIIGKSTGGELWVNGYKNDLSKRGRPNPHGRGKIFEFYLEDHVKTPPPQVVGAYASFPDGEEWWGYSFTFFTTDDDIVTDCKVTKRLLRRW
jgi:hypothetical protein